MNPHSDHFTYHTLAEGIWAAIVKPTGLAASNSGIIALGDQTLIFDTTYSPASAAELRTHAETLNGHPVTAVLNSHWHSDHVFGNAVFDAYTAIYATEKTRDLMQEKTAKEIAEFKAHWPTQQAKWAERSRVAETEAERLDYAEGVQFAQAIIDTFSELQLRLPDHTFTDRVEFKGTKRTAEFVTFGGGHTGSDAVLYLPAERIVFMGDLLVTKNHPDLTHGDPHTWRDILAKVKALHPVTLIPGHGEIATVDDATMLESYIKEILQMARRSGDSQPPAFTEGWDNADAFEKNLEFVRGLR